MLWRAYRPVRCEMGRQGIRTGYSLVSLVRGTVAAGAVRRTSVPRSVGPPRASLSPVGAKPTTQTEHVACTSLVRVWRAHRSTVGGAAPAPWSLGSLYWVVVQSTVV